MKRLAWWLRRLADRIDYPGSPKGTGLSFTFEDGNGITFNQDGRGCPLWYLGNSDYDRAYAEALNAPARVDWDALAEGRSPFTIPPEGGTSPVGEHGFIRPDGKPLKGTITFTPIPPPEGQ